MWSIDCLIEWMIDWRFNGSTTWPIHWLIAFLINWLIAWYTVNVPRMHRVHIGLYQCVHSRMLACSYFICLARDGTEAVQPRFSLHGSETVVADDCCQAHRSDARADKLVAQEPDLAKVQPCLLNYRCCWWTQNLYCFEYPNVIWIYTTDVVDALYETQKHNSEFRLVVVWVPLLNHQTRTTNVFPLGILSAFMSVVTEA